MYHGKFVFLNASHSVHKFPQPLSYAGKQEYEFEFRSPEWLPPSTIYSAEFCSSNLKIRYGVWAQIKPLNAKDFIDNKKTISVFRASKEVFISRAPIQVPIVDTLR